MEGLLDEAAPKPYTHAKDHAPQGTLEVPKSVAQQLKEKHHQVSSALVSVHASMQRWKLNPTFLQIVYC